MSEVFGRFRLPKSLSEGLRGKGMDSLILVGDSGVPLGNEGESDTASLGQLDEGFLALADGEDVGDAGGEGGALSVSDVDDLVGTGVLLNVHEGADTTNVVSANDHDKGVVFEFNNAIDLASLKVKLASSRKSIKYKSKKERRARTLTFTESFFLMSGWG